MVQTVEVAQQPLPASGALTLLRARPGTIRVLLLIDEMEVGGTQRQVVHLAKGLDHASVEVSVAFFRNRSFLVDELAQAGVRTFEISKRRRVDPAFIWRLVRVMRSGQFHIVHCFGYTAELWGAFARRFVACPDRPALVTSVRSIYNWYSPLQWRVKRWTSTQASLVVANTRAGRDYTCERARLAPERIAVIYNGVADAPAVALSRAPVSCTSGCVIALFVGRLVEDKGLPLLIAAMRRLHMEGVQIILKIAGKGPLTEELARAIAGASLGDAVELLGERGDTWELMRAADFVVLPSLREGLSNVILEAMVCGRPVVASSVGGNLELVEPMRTGLLFPSGDEGALTAAMRRLVNDRPLREALGTCARRRALECYTVAAMVKATHAAYLRCLAPAATQPAREARQ